MAKKNKEKYYCKSDLINRGWTQKLIDEILPEPTYRMNPYYRSGPQMQTWSESVVLIMEDTARFREEKEKLQKRRDNARNNKRRKEEEMVNRVEDAIPENPIDEYRYARSIKRKFILHIGPTNSGKTYQSLERLKTASKGVYLSPLRLLALEIYDKFNYEGVFCSMITGEEILEVPCSKITSSTIEILDTNIHYDIAVVDEVQMISDEFRGHNWTRAILGLYADEIHLCMAPEAEGIAIKLIEECGDDYETVRHERNTPLKFDYKDVSLKKVEPGDALIVFSRRSVLSLAAELESAGIKASVIYGNLPPTSRREQVRRFNEGETQVVISTDAIGMGLNLPIKRIIFMETEKFDGKERRKLKPEEVKQIAGRAGRYGIYDEGYVLAIDNQKYIDDCLKVNVRNIKTAYLGLTEDIATLPYPLTDIAKAWESIKPPAIYNKMDLSEMLFLYAHLKKSKLIKKYSKEDIYKMITCSVDIKNDDLVELWLYYCNTYQKYDYLDFPGTYGVDLADLEKEYRALDLYYQFSKRLEKEYDEEKLAESKMRVTKEINKILKTQKKKFKKRCRCCGKELPFDYSYGICESCYEYRREFHYY